MSRAARSSAPMGCNHGAEAIPAQTDIAIIGGGPGGLACAQHLAAAGAQVLVLERKSSFGRKVCAGGITCHGMLRLVPQEVIERVFPVQHICSPRQRIRLEEPQPIIATVNRERLGTWMAGQAQAAGARLCTGAQVVALTDTGLVVRDATGRVQELRCGHVVGADGARSLVRRTLGLSSRLSIGLNTMLPVEREQMEWHLHPRLFASGYAWIFPHATTTSLGAFSDARLMNAKRLQTHVSLWAAQQGIENRESGVLSLQAGWVNYDYQGLCFGRRWLVGDAAGLSSALTGEGIYPAVLSGRAVAAMILASQSGRTGQSFSPELEALLKRQRQHRRVAAMAGQGLLASALLAELFLLLLRLRAIDFHRLEMASVAPTWTLSEES